MIAFFEVLQYRRMRLNLFFSHTLTHTHTHTHTDKLHTICRRGAVHRLLLFSPARLLIQEGVWWLRALSHADATMVTRCLVSWQGPRLISMATAATVLSSNKCTSKSELLFAVINFTYISVLFYFSESTQRLSTWVCMVQQVEGGCEGPGGRSSSWACLRVWLNCCLGFWLAAENKCGRSENNLFFNIFILNVLNKILYLNGVQNFDFILHCF